MPATTTTTTDKEIIKQRLISAGIGDRFADMKLSAFGDLGQRFLATFAPQNVGVAKPVLRNGFLCYFSGKGAREFAYTLAAGLLSVFDARVECLHLSDLSDALDNRDHERIEELTSSDVLAVTEFLNTGSNPLPQRSAFRVESFLLERSEQEGKTVLLAGDGKVAQTQWWTPRLVTRIQDAFIQETVSQYAHPTAAKIK